MKKSIMISNICFVVFIGLFLMLAINKIRSKEKEIKESGKSVLQVVGEELKEAKQDFDLEEKWIKCKHLKF